MTQAELQTALLTLGLPVAYGEFGKPTAPPFITYQFTASADIMADDQNYAPVEGFDIELYTVKKDLVREAAVQALLKSLGLPYSKTEAWVEAEKLRQVVYAVQLV